MTTGYVVTARGDLDTLFRARTSTAIANVNFKNSGGVDLSQLFEPRFAQAAIANTGFVAGSADLATLFMGATSPITLANRTVSSTVITPSNPQVGYTLENDGDIATTIQAVNADVGDWIVPKASAPGTYEARATLTGGVSPTSGTPLNTWTALTVSPNWGLARSTNGVSSSILLIEIRQGTTVLGSCTVTLTVTREI